MPFVELHKSRAASVSHTISVPTMSAIITKSGDKHIYMRLPRDLVHSTWSDKLVNDGRSVKLGILEGTDNDAGFIMLVHNPVAYTFTATAFSKSDGRPSMSSFNCKVDLQAFKHYVPNVMPQPSAAMEFSADGPALLLQVPQWFVYTPNRVVVRATMVPVEKAPQGRRPDAVVQAQQRRLVR